MTEPFVRSTYDAPFARLRLVTRGERLAALDYEGYEARLAKLFARRFPGAGLVDGPAPGTVVRALDAYFSGDLGALGAIETEGGGTPFQETVWAALRRIRPGETTSYGALAAAIGRPARRAPSASRTGRTRSPSSCPATA